MSDAETYYDEYWRRDTLSPLEDPLAPERVRILLRLLRGHAPPIRALDAGAGAGDTVAALAAAGIDVSGIDVSEEAVSLARSRHPELGFTAHSAEDVPWPVEPRTLDLVVSFEVIEHLLRPRRLLEGARDALKPGGKLALTTPYHGRVKNLALALVAFDRHFAVEGDHVRFFSDAALSRLLRETGFRVDELIHFGRRRPFSSGVFAWATRV